jgi:phytoene dehydrogenase-like protein
VTRYDAVVVGSGPNGLTAAARLATAGRKVLVVEASPTIGGGSRTKPIGDDGARYDVCAAVHPFGISSPAFEALRLTDLGLTWLQPPVSLAHPFDDGTAALLTSDTSAHLGEDARRWQQVIGPFSRGWDATWRHRALDSVVSSTLHHPLAMARFGSFAALPAAALVRLFATRNARALIAGMAAHGGARLTQPGTAGVALALLAAGEARGMPIAAGGSQSIVDRLAAIIRRAGGEIEIDRTVTSLAQLPATNAVLLDVSPHQAAAIAGLPEPRWKHGVAAWKIDMVLSGPMPWTAPACRDAGTVHLGGTWSEIAKAESMTTRGHLPELPYMLVGQPSVNDPSRAPEGQHVVWAYRHVPNGCTDEAATTGMERQLDRFAPGWRDLVLHRKITSATDFSRYNANYVGGDMAGGAMTPWQVIARPRLALDPFRTKRDGIWVCSQSTPPGPGVHGMCGWHAAGSVLRSGRT